MNAQSCLVVRAFGLSCFRVTEDLQPSRAVRIIPPLSRAKKPEQTLFRRFEMILPLLLLALAAGVLLPVQAGVNAQLRSVLGSPLAAGLVSFLVGSAGLALVTLVLRVPIPLRAAWAGSAWWQWTGGLIGAVYVLSIIVLAP